MRVGRALPVTSARQPTSCRAGRSCSGSVGRSWPHTLKTMRPTSVLVLSSLLLSVLGCSGRSSPSSPTMGPTPAPQPAPVAEMPDNLPPLDPVSAAVKSAFQAEYGELVPRPATYYDPTPTCSGLSYRTSVAYLPRFIGDTQPQVEVIYTTPDGGSLTDSNDRESKYRQTVDARPAGRFRVLTVLLTHDATFTEDSLSGFTQAQSAINEDHATFARSKGYSIPIVQFEFTNMTIPAEQVSDRRSVGGIGSAVAARGGSTSGSDFVAAINIDPNLSEGGFARLGGTAPSSSTWATSARLATGRH